MAAGQLPKSNHGIQEDLEDCNYLISGMIYLRPFPDWGIVAKKLYQLNVLMTERGFSRRNLFSKKQYDDINRYGEKIDKAFDIKVPYANNHEKQLADQIILNRLNWVYGPKWRVEDNGEEFREVAKLLSYRPHLISAPSESERSFFHEIMYMKRRQPWK